MTLSLCSQTTRGICPGSVSSSSGTKIGSSGTSHIEQWDSVHWAGNPKTRRMSESRVKRKYCRTMEGRTGVCLSLCICVQVKGSGALGAIFPKPIPLLGASEVTDAFSLQPLVLVLVEFHGTVICLPHKLQFKVFLPN